MLLLSAVIPSPQPLFHSLSPQSPSLPWGEGSPHVVSEIHVRVRKSKAMEFLTL